MRLRCFWNGKTGHRQVPEGYPKAFPFRGMHFFASIEKAKRHVPTWRPKYNMRRGFKGYKYAGNACKCMIYSIFWHILAVSKLFSLDLQSVHVVLCREVGRSAQLLCPSVASVWGRFDAQEQDYLARGFHQKEPDFRTDDLILQKVLSRAFGCFWWSIYRSK